MDKVREYIAIPSPSDVDAASLCLLSMEQSLEKSVGSICLVHSTEFHYSMHDSHPEAESKAIPVTDRLCGLVVRVLGYRTGGRVRFPAIPEKKVVGLERGPTAS
jgi:hypothetical protein